MRFPEQKLWDRIRANLGHKDILLCRVENIVENGWPDVIAISDGTVTAIELKNAAWPKRAKTRIQLAHPLTADQRNWHFDWTTNGGRSLIVIGVARAVFAIDGREADRINSMTRAQVESYATDWPTFAAALRGHLTIGAKR